MEAVIWVLIIFSIISAGLIAIIILNQKKHSTVVKKISGQNAQLLESIEKYIEIFNEHNVKDFTQDDESRSEILAQSKLREIRKEYINKLKKPNSTLTEEHEMLIDFVSLTLSLLIKTPPNLRVKLIEENTDNEMMKKILLSKLDSIKNHYIPVSLLEVALSKEE